MYDQENTKKKNRIMDYTKTCVNFSISSITRQHAFVTSTTLSLLDFSGPR